MYHTLDAPLSVHLELTSSCNFRCRHCYNFWRPNNDFPSILLTKELASKVIDQLEENRVFHVVLTGGEPLLNFDVLVFVIKELKRRQISFGLNTNASLLTEERAKILFDAGLKTILVSLLSNDMATQDYISHNKGSFNKIVRGINIAKLNNIRIAVNMVVSRTNLHHVYNTGTFAKLLGAFAFSATRVMPPRYDSALVEPEFILSDLDVKEIVRQMAQLNNMGLRLESLVPYPACYLDAQDANEIFGGRTCSAGKTSLAISAESSARACAHFEGNYGSLCNENLYSIWTKMHGWRDGEFLPSECKSCSGIARCGGGCRIASAEKSFCAKDPLMSEPANYCRMGKEQAPMSINMNSTLRICKHCRFRNDLELGIVNTGGTKNTFVSNETLLLLERMKNVQLFTPLEMKIDNSINMGNMEYLQFLSALIDKKVMEVIA